MCDTEHADAGEVRLGKNVVPPGATPVRNDKRRNVLIGAAGNARRCDVMRSAVIRTRRAQVKWPRKKGHKIDRVNQKRGQTFQSDPFDDTGAAGRNRTHDPLVRSQVLYPAELRPRKT